VTVFITADAVKARKEKRKNKRLAKAVAPRLKIFFQDAAYNDQLLGEGILAVAEWDPLSPRSGSVEKTEPQTIDGQEVELGRGWYGGTLMYEQPWLNGKQHGIYGDGMKAETGNA
jgi:hypothetical protein